jgi:hypothetical protein
MYCTLQEAYNVPSFDPPPRKKRCSPDAQARASATPYEPYRRDGGNGTGDFTMYKYAKPKTIQGNKPIQRRIPHEPFQDMDNSVGMRTSYRALKGDRDEYCRQYGVCTEDQTVERFTDTPKQQQDEDRCASAPDFYEVPLSEETKRQFGRAMDTSLGQETSSTAPYSQKMRYDDMSRVSGYYDEDLEQYLKTAEVSNTPKRFPMNADAVPTDIVHDPKRSPLQQTIKRFSEHSIREPLKSAQEAEEEEEEKEKPEAPASSNGWDLFMFILAGLLVIVLVDMLFRMGVMVGMRHTVEMMTPFMKEFEELMKMRG